MIRIDATAYPIKVSECFIDDGTEPTRRLLKLAPPPLKRIRPATPLRPLAAKLLVVGMGWRR